ncbi:MAG: hypothetical protein M3Y56_13855, partial [Armatimonadota bacterium]|nr:hypothetical protein [Armatimonadota bacterium]
IRKYFSDPLTYGFLNQLILRRPTVPAGVFSHNPAPGILNGSLWTIDCELVLYGMVTLFGLMGLYRKRHYILGLFLATIIGYKALHFLPGLANHHAWVFGNVIVMAYFLMPYLAGMVCYLYRDVIPLSRHLFLGCLCLLVLSLHSLLWLTLPICGAYALFYVAFSPTLRLSGFGRRGDFSYGIYLYAFPIQQLLVMYLPRTVSVIPFFFVSWVFSFAAANASWYLIERPTMRWKRRVDSKTTERVAQSKTANLVLSGY